MLAGEKLKESKKKAKMASAQSTTSRDWGKVWCSFVFDPAIRQSASHLLRSESGKMFGILRRAWRVSGVRRCAQSFHRTISDRYPASKLAASGSSGSRFVELPFIRSAHIFLMFII